jgi:hypothetical protein
VKVALKPLTARIRAKQWGNRLVVLLALSLLININT